MSSISRRSFLKSSATAAAVTLAGSAAYGANERIRVGVIGMRSRGHQDASDMLRSRQFDIATICDCDTAMLDRAVTEIGPRLTQKPAFETDFRKVLEDKDLDAVVVATPDHWHAIMTVMALDAGKHVFVEKPASFNIAEAQAMVAAQEKHPALTCMVGTQQRSGRHFIEARDFIQSGGLGKVGFCRTWIAHTRPTLPIVADAAPPETLDWEMWVGPAPYQPYNEYKCHYNWHFVKNYGTGEMGNWGAHWIDVGRWLLDLGLPSSAMGLGGTYVVHDAKETPDTQTVLYEFPELTLLWEQRLWTKFPINGESGGVEFGGEKGSVVITRGGWIFTPAEGEVKRHPGSDLTGAHVRNFADAIRGEKPCNAPIQEGAKSAIMCHLGNLTVTLQRRLDFDAAALAFKGDDEANALRSRAYRPPWDTIL